MMSPVRMMAVFLSLAVGALASANAAEPRFHPAPGAMPVIGRYMVTLADSVAEDLVESSVQGMAMTYSGRLEPRPSANVRQFAMTMEPARARTLSADPRVREVVEVPQSDEAGSAASPTAPSRADLSRHGLVPVAQDSSSSGTYLYDGSGNIKFIGSDSYVYDNLGRLKAATVQGSQQSYSYDAFGNRYQATRGNGAAGCVGGCEAPSTVFVQSNHLTGATYDEAGNVKIVSGSTAATYSYDGTGMATRATVGSDDRMFVYTADDERIAVRNGLSWMWTVRDLSGKVLRELTSLETQSSPLALGSHTWTKDHVWRDGQLMASVFQGPSAITTYHYHLDHLGTPRLVTDSNGLLIGKHVYYPFGAEMDLTPHESTVELMKFTGHERDIVAADNASVDYMHARYYNGNLGRFLSVDPVLGEQTQPQSWNRYAYVGNSPTSFSDVTGRERGRYGPPPKLAPGAAREAAHQINQFLTRAGQVAMDAVFLGGVIESVVETGDEELVQPAAEKLEADASVIIEEAETQAHVLYRGGSSTQVRDIDVKIKDGLVQPRNGLSVNTDPAKAAKYGEPHRVDSLPEGLTVKQTGGDPGHHEIVPSAPMPKAQFFELLGQIILSRM
jgi:RHS repeat-associated protein